MACGEADALEQAAALLREASEEYAEMGGTDFSIRNRLSIANAEIRSSPAL